MKKRLLYYFLILCTFMGLNFNIYNLYEGNTKDLLKLGLIGSGLLIYFIYTFYQKSSIISKEKSLKIIIYYVYWLLLFIFSNY